MASSICLCTCTCMCVCPQAMKFLYSQGFSTIGHVQTGNVFVVNDICKVGGYDNALLGYKTRLYRLCKDHTAHLDVILFGE